MRGNRKRTGKDRISSFTSNRKLYRSGNNDFTGTIPQQYATMESLTEFDLSHNRLTGSIPASFGDDSFGISGDMTLTVFRAASNNLVGHFPVGLTRMPQLGIIDLSEFKVLFDVILPVD